MAGLKKGLGRGLDALLEPYSDPVLTGKQVVEVSVRDIDTNLLQPRKQFDEDALSELAASIKTHGVVQPLIVKKKGERYMIIAGERRYRAARMAGLETVPVLVADYDDAQIHEVALIENIQRENLNPMEEAAAIRFLMQQHDMTQEEVSARIGKSRPAVANALRLLTLPDSVTELVRGGKLTAGHARALAGVSDATTQEKLAAEAVNLGYSVRALESRVQRLAAEKKPAERKASPQTPVLRRAENALREKLGTRVKIAGDEKKGKITIDYFSEDDLRRIYACIAGDED